MAGVPAGDIISKLAGDFFGISSLLVFFGHESVASSRTIEAWRNRPNAGDHTRMFISRAWCSSAAGAVADGFHSSVPGFDLTFGRRAIASSSTI